MLKEPESPTQPILWHTHIRLFFGLRLLGRTGPSPATTLTPQKMSQDAVKLNLFNRHFSYIIGTMEMYSHCYDYVSVRSGFKNPGGAYQPPSTIFEKTGEEGIPFDNHLNFHNTMPPSTWRFIIQGMATFPETRQSPSLQQNIMFSP